MDKKDLDYLENQGFEAEEAKRLVAFKEKLKKRYHLTDEIVKRADQGSDELLLDIIRARNDQSVEYEDLYEQSEYFFTRLGTSTPEGTDLFDEILYPNLETYEPPEILEKKVARILALYKLGAAINEDPPYSIERDKLRKPKWEDGNKKVYYTELKSPHQAYSNIYLVRAVEKKELGYEYGENLVYTKTEKSLRASLPLLFRAPARA